MKINKRDLILNYIIESYLDENTPVGSTELGLRMDGLIPASTIRVYFKKLNEEGAIKQLHVSSGRIPTNSTMKKYWLNKLDFSKKLIINDGQKLSDIVSKFNIYCMVFSCDYEILQEVINYNNRFIILCFNNEEIILKFNIKVYKFLSSLIGVELSELEKFSIQIGLSELRAKIKELKNSKIEFLANEVVAYQVFSDERFKMLLDPSVTTMFDRNIIFSPIFDEGFMGIKRDVIFNNSESTMLCAGSIYEDYEKFFNNIMEAA